MKIKKNIKLIIIIIVGILLVSGISVYATATYIYNATDVSYLKNGTDNISVADALNDLYANKKESIELNDLKTILGQTDATASDILSGKKAYSNGELITGIANIENNWTLVITYKIYLGWNGNYGYGSQNGKITVKNVNGTKTITNENGSIISPTENWNGNYYINAKIADIAIESFTLDN